MAPKGDATKKTASKAKSGPPKHAPFLDMIKDAILNLKERNGSSRQAIKKYIQANNNLGGLNESSFNTHISRALSTGEENGVFERPKGPSGPVKLKKAGPKPAAEKKESKPAAAKKSTSTKKATSAKKSATKKATTTKKTATAAKPKANASKPRAKKVAVPNAAPAVGEEKSVVLGKTKSGRVTKSKAPQAAKPAAKKAGVAKKVATKKAAPKKSTTPKKVEAAS